MNGCGLQHPGEASIGPAPYRLVMCVAGQVEEVTEENRRFSVGQPEAEHL